MQPLVAVHLVASATSLKKRCQHKRAVERTSAHKVTIASIICKTKQPQSTSHMPAKLDFTEAPRPRQTSKDNHSKAGRRWPRSAARVSHGQSDQHPSR